MCFGSQINACDLKIGLFVAPPMRRLQSFKPMTSALLDSDRGLEPMTSRLRSGVYTGSTVIFIADKLQFSVCNEVLSSSCL